MSKKSRKPRTLSVAVAGIVAFSLSGCGQDEQVYCGDANRDVVDPELCEDSGGGGYFIYHGSSYPAGLRPGDRIPSGGESFSYNDAAARDKIGLPKTGKITGSKGGFGTKVSTGGFGSGFGRSFGG